MCRECTDFLAQDDEWLMRQFRFPRAVLLELCAELGPLLERQTQRNSATPVSIHVIMTVGFLATGTFQKELADRSGISQSSLSSVMPAVWDCILNLSPR